MLLVLTFCINLMHDDWDVYRLRPGPVRDFGTERALAEPLGPIYMIFPNSSTRFTLLTELNLTVPKARPEAHTFDFIGSGPGPVRDFGTERALAEPLGPNTTNFPSSCPRFTLLTELNLSLKARPEAHTFEFIGSGPSEKSGAP